jgi:hypothetical protein
VAITDPAQGGYHAAARYCDKLSYGGYTDWYLPNRYELNLMYTNAALIPGLDISANWYLSSTEYAYDGYWSQRFNDGYQATSDRKNYNTHKVRCVRRIDPCVEGVPTPGTICKGGTVFLGTLSPGATSGSGTDRYMTTPGGCQFPSGSISGGSSYSSYALSDFTPICLGTDSLQLNWNDGTTNWFDNPSLPNSTIESEMDIYYGNTNTANIASITTGANGGYHAAARFCDKLSFGGYTDWYLPNKNELILMWTNQANIPGLNRTGAYYWASTEYNNIYAWVQRFTDGGLGWNPKNYWASLVRCVRRF